MKNLILNILLYFVVGILISLKYLDRPTAPIFFLIAFISIWPIIMRWQKIKLFSLKGFKKLGKNTWKIFPMPIIGVLLLFFIPTIFTSNGGSYLNHLSEKLANPNFSSLFLFLMLANAYYSKYLKKIEKEG